MDTSFILSAVRNKIDFFDELFEYKIFIPEEVLREIKSFAVSDKKKRFKEDAELALKILSKKKFELVKLPHKHVDKGLISLAKDDKYFIIATLDRGIKKHFKNRILTVRNEKSLEFV